MNIDAARQREALRQQMLLRALLRDARPAVVGGWMREQATAPERFTRGLQAYQANAGALAERALEVVFPVLRQLIGEASFAALARVFWHRQPPQRGDMAQWGEALPDFIAGDQQLADEPFLPDVARLEWLLHQAATVSDAPPRVEGIERLAVDDPGTLTMRFVPGTTVMLSPHPVASIWLAHQAEGDERQALFARVREAFAHGRGECVLVTREGFKPVVHAMPPTEALFVQTLCAGQVLEQAMWSAAQGDVSSTRPSFDFSAWLVQALSRRWIAAVEAVAPQLQDNAS